MSNELAAFNTTTGAWSKQECKGPTPIGRTGHTLTAVEPCHKLIVFGGLNHDKGYLEDVHALDTDTLEWSGMLATSNKGPCGRDKHSAVAFGDRVVIFGGFGMVPAPKSEEEAEASGVQGAGGALFFGWHNDVHVLNVSSMTWEDITVEGTAPTNRAAHVACAMGKKNMLVMGGRDMRSRTNDLYMLDVEAMQWSTIETTNTPCKRSFHMGTFLESTGRLVIFGGVDVNGRHHNTVHSLDVTQAIEKPGREWEEVSVEGEKPSGRGNCGVGLVGDRLFIIGGSSDWDTEKNICTTFYKDSFALDLK